MAAAAAGVMVAAATVMAAAAGFCNSAAVTKRNPMPCRPCLPCQPAGPFPPGPPTTSCTQLQCLQLHHLSAVAYNQPDVCDSPVAAPLPVLCVELEGLTVCCALVAHYVTHGGWVVMPGGVLAPVLDACLWW